MSSNVSRSVMEDYGCSSEKVKCVYSGANVKAGMDESLDASRYSARNILFVGREWTRKGGPVLLEAFAKVLEVYPDATLSIAGCAPEVSLTNCKVHGLMSLEDVKECYKQASLFCLPTKLEPFGIAFLEAMAHKMPVVGTNVGAIPDFIHHGRNGYLVDPNDTDELARRLVELVGDPQKCMAFGDYGHNLLWERYTWEKTGKRIRESIMGALVS